jgi:phytoene desaturase
MHAVPLALAAAAERVGGVVRLGETATGLLRRFDGAIAGVRLAGGEPISADAVVCTLDLPAAYEQFLPELSPPRPARPGTGAYSPSAVVWHVGVRGLPGTEVAHHNIHFAADWDEAFRTLLGRGELMPDPSRLVTVASLDDPTAAPAGCSTLYVLEPVPNLAGGPLDWRIERGPMRERLAGFLDRAGYPADIVTERLVTPWEWRAQGLAAGTPFALAHSFAQTGPFRPPNVERRVPGLFFAGSGTVPGVGVPMVLISGKLAARRVASYLGGGT